jgi:uncharacterized protein YceK
MSMMPRTFVVTLLVVLLAGCATYYKVTDPSSSKTYYTEKVKREGTAVQFKDAQTGGEMTLQNSSVQEIDKQEYQAGVTKK